MEFDSLRGLLDLVLSAVSSDALFVIKKYQGDTLVTHERQEAENEVVWYITAIANMSSGGPLDEISILDSRWSVAHIQLRLKEIFRVSLSRNDVGVYYLDFDNSLAQTHLKLLGIELDQPLGIFQKEARRVRHQKDLIINESETED